MGRKTEIHNSFYKLTKPPGDIIQIYCKYYQTVILTTEGIFTYGYPQEKLPKNVYVYKNATYTTILSQKNIYLMYPFTFGNNYMYATEEGLFLKDDNKIDKIDIDGINDIIFIDLVWVLTTTGLYYARLPDIEKVSINNVKKISYTDKLHILTYDNKIYQKDWFEEKFKELPHHHVYDMYADGVLITDKGIEIVDDMSHYFE